MQEIMILDSLPQIELAPKVVSAKTGKNCLTLRYFDFSKFFGPGPLKIIVSMISISFWSHLSQNKIFFSQKFKISQFPEFFQFFLENDCNSAIFDSMTSLKASNGFVYFTF